MGPLMKCRRAQHGSAQAKRLDEAGGGNRLVFQGVAGEFLWLLVVEDDGLINSSIVC